MENYHHEQIDRLLASSSSTDPLNPAGLMRLICSQPPSSENLQEYRLASLSYKMPNLIDNFDELMKISPRDFECLVCDLLRADGYEDVQLVKGSNFSGPDIKVFYCSPSGDRQLLLVECKRWEKAVGIDVVRSLMYRVDQEFGANTGMLVTTSRFTKTQSRRRRESIRGDFP